METQIKEWLQTVRTKCDRFPVFQQIEDSISLPKEYVAILSAAVAALLVFFCMGAGSLCNVAGFVYPAWKSFQAIESSVRGDDTQWLIYWIIYAFFSILEVFDDFLLYWIPFYYAFKLAFLLWAMLPQTKGAKFLYDAFLKDLLKKNESQIDTAMKAAKKKASAMAAEAAKATSDLTKEGIKKAKEFEDTDDTKED